MQRVSKAQLVDIWLDTFGHLLNEEGSDFVVETNDPAFGAAIEAFTDVLIEAGWTWQRWFATERREIRRLRRSAAGISLSVFARN
jgi:hypothetical protein